MNNIFQTLVAVLSAIRNMLKMVFASDVDVMSDDVRNIMANPKDRETFMQAVDKMKQEQSSETTVTLSDKSTFTLVR